MGTATTIESQIRFEEDFIRSTNRSITSQPDIAITEFVANAWDAGAFNVQITIPYKTEDIISVEDDGVGMTDEEFRERWLTLKYNRQKHQGKLVEFPADVDGYKRVAFGRNGVGRHGMLCFANDYFVETWRDGRGHRYHIAQSSGQAPFVIIGSESFEKEGHGTKVFARVSQNLPAAATIEDIISVRFLFDPKFTVRINNRQISLWDCKGIQLEEEITLCKDIQLRISILDSSKSAVKMQQHGIAFWVSGRLVGNPSWTYNGVQFLDGRSKAAKQYTVIIQTEDLIDEILPDWSGFLLSSSRAKNFFKEFEPRMMEYLRNILRERIQEVQDEVIQETSYALMDLGKYDQREVSGIIEVITQKDPTISPKKLQTTIEAIATIKRAKKGNNLLQQLGAMSSDEIDKLSDMLTEWSVNDILTVLNEIDRRIIVIEAIERLQDDKNTDELHTLHPLVLDARWLFGPEFDSPHFTSNRTLATVVKTLFKDGDYDQAELSNPGKRPDIVCLKRSSFKAVCTDRKDETVGLVKPDQILLIELKRGGSKLTDKEFSQARNYVRQIKKSQVLHVHASIHAFVVGAEIGDIDTHVETDSGTIDVVTYGMLVDSAKGRLFRLREHLSTHYDSMDQESIVEKALKTFEKPIKGFPE